MFCKLISRLGQEALPFQWSSSVKTHGAVLCTAAVAVSNARELKYILPSSIVLFHCCSSDVLQLPLLTHLRRRVHSTQLSAHTCHALKTSVNRYAFF